MKKKTHEQFVQELKLIQPELKIVTLYQDYETNIIVEYLDIKYFMLPKKLLRNNKVSVKCAVDKTDWFIKTVRNLFPDITILGKYINNNSPILILDKNNIKYNAIPYLLLTGNLPSWKTVLSKTEKFKFNLKSVLPDLEIISDYKGRKTKLFCRDKLGIVYYSLPCKLLKGVFPTIDSAIDKNIAFSKKSEFIHNNKYNYSKVHYINDRSKLKIICPEHGEFIQEARSHMRGMGCRTCGIEKLAGPMESLYKHKPETEVSIYFFRCFNAEEEFYKIGLSIKPKERVWGIPYKIEIISTYKSTVGELYPIEQSYHNKFKEMNINYTPQKFFAGWTECFKI